MTFPFGEKPAAPQAVAPVAPQAAPQAVAPVAPVAPQAEAVAQAAPEAVAPQAVAPVAPQAAPVVEEKVRKKQVRKATKMIDEEDIVFVCANVQKMSYLDMAQARNLTKFQVNRILMDTKKKLRIAAKGTPKEALVEEHIKNVFFNEKNV